MEDDNAEDDFRLYWNQPSLVAQLSEERRKKITKKFFELLNKSKKKVSNKR